MIGFLGGHLEAGVDIVLETVGLEGRLDERRPGHDR